MGDSFFGFNTNLPSLTEDELQTLRQQDLDNNKESETVQNYNNKKEVYDFETLRRELGVDVNETVNENLEDQVIEQTDVYNEIIFDDTPVSQNFDFSGNTQRFHAGNTEDEAFFVKRRAQEDAFYNPWATSSVLPFGSPIVRERRFGDVGQASPTCSKSIWGNFESDTSPGSYPFGFGQSNQMQRPTIQQQMLQQQQQLQQEIRERYAREVQRNDQDLNNFRQNNYQHNDNQRNDFPRRNIEVPHNHNGNYIQAKSSYDGLMTQHDKDLINRIQLSQLASGDPYADDFYYQVYSSLRQRAGIPLKASVSSVIADNQLDGRDSHTVQLIQQQLQHIVKVARRRPKQSQLSLEGALGTIASLTVRNPRQALQVPQSSSSSNLTSEPSTPKIEKKPTPTTKPSASAMNKHHVLKAIEDMYTVILELEQLRRQGPPQGRPDDETDEIDPAEAYNQKHAAKVATLWDSFCPTTNGEMPFLVSLLSVNKGKKMIPRIIRQLHHDQNLTLLAVFISNFSKYQMCRHVVYPGTTVANVDEAKRQKFVKYEDVEIFMNISAPPLLALIEEATLSTVNELLGLILEKNNVMTVAYTKPGLVFLTMLLSRAEILKQGGGPVQGLPDPTQEELSVLQERYFALFNTLCGHYLSIFPSLYYLVSSDPNTPMMQISLSVDDMYVWQFLAAMAVGASMDQQHTLVTEVRDRVMDNIILVKGNRLPFEEANHRINNVNLFLHALGLDASQVSIPM